MPDEDRVMKELLEILSQSDHALTSGDVKTHYMNRHNGNTLPSPGIYLSRLRRDGHAMSITDAKTECGDCSPYTGMNPYAYLYYVQKGQLDRWFELISARRNPKSGISVSNESIVRMFEACDSGMSRRDAAAHAGVQFCTAETYMKKWVKVPTDFFYDVFDRAHGDKVWGFEELKEIVRRRFEGTFIDVVVEGMLNEKLHYFELMGRCEKIVKGGNVLYKARKPYEEWINKTVP